jgi:FMN phosphatase YigB (HAD superfamily)
MKAHSEDNPVTRLWRTARVKGWRSLITQEVDVRLVMLRDRVLFGCGGMDDALGWVNRNSHFSVYSFDIFDTLLRRRIHPPEQTKQLAAEHTSALLAQHGVQLTPEEVLNHRNRVEKALRDEAVSQGKDAECFLDDIIAEMLRVANADSLLNGEEIIRHEIGLEKKATQPMPAVKTVLSHLRSAGKRVVAVSETYLSLSQMSEILRSHGLLEYIDRLYLSSEAEKSKVTGRLFEHVAAEEGSNIVHMGDSYLLDNRVPRSRGIRTLWFRNRSEEQRKNQLMSLLNGANKMAYVNAIIGGDRGSITGLYRIGYDVLGPAITVFVHSVAQAAMSEGIETIFFVARDGYVFKKVYEILQQNIPEYRIPGKYMCLGRIPVRSASTHELTYSEVIEVRDYMLRSRGKDASFGEILGSHGLEPSHFVGIAGRFQVNLDEPIKEPAHHASLRQMLESREFRGAVRAQSDATREALREYLVDVGFMGKRMVAVVDANAEGITQLLLERAFANDQDFPTVTRYYFNAVNLGENFAGINLDVPQVRGIACDWRTTPRHDQGAFFTMGTLIELFGHPNHGVTVGYEEVGGKTRPTFRRTLQKNQYPMTSQALQGILCYARDYASCCDLHGYRCEELLEHVKKDITNWVTFPPRQDLEALKDLFVTSDWPRESHRNLIEQLTIRDLIAIRPFKKKLASSMWRQATLRLAPVPRLDWLLRKAGDSSKRARSFPSCLRRR